MSLGQRPCHSTLDGSAGFNAMSHGMLSSQNVVCKMSISPPNEAGSFADDSGLLLLNAWKVWFPIIRKMEEILA